MSVLLKTDLAEYARQCTLQRRRYEACVQESQQGGMNEATAASACSLTQPNMEAPTESNVFKEGAENVKKGSLVDLLGLAAEPLTWDNSK